jgi:hypothetical protein
VRGVAWDQTLGGWLFDQIVLDLLVEQFKEKHPKVAPPPEPQPNPNPNPNPYSSPSPWVDPNPKPSNPHPPPRFYPNQGGAADRV